MTLKIISPMINELKGKLKSSSPILDSLKRLFIRNVIHQDKSHRSTVICSCNGAISLLPGCETKSVSPSNGLKIRESEWITQKTYLCPKFAA